MPLNHTRVQPSRDSPHACAPRQPTSAGEAAAVFDHALAHDRLGASIFWVRVMAALGGEQAAVEYWQVTRGGGQRGIVEIVEPFV